MVKRDAFTNDDLKAYQDANEGSHDGGKAIARADHQARNDYRHDGSPFGALPDGKGKARRVSLESKAG